jgi:pectin methylesterase-like acyl-CoA thioesterase
MAWRTLSLGAALLLAGTATASPAPRQSAPFTPFPVNAARNVCPDTPLRLTFSSAISRGEAGLIRIVDAASGQTVETIDAGKAVATQPIGGMSGFSYYPIVLTDQDAFIHLRHGALQYGRSYYVTVERGAFKDSRGAVEALTGPDSWRFSTRAAPPPASSTRLVVSAAGDGDFCTLQGALDFLPDGNTTPRTIFIRNGTYREIVFFAGKHEITLLGEDRKKTIIAYTNNANLNSSGGNPFGGANPNPAAEDPNRGGSVYRRGLVTAHRANGLVIANLTLRNTTPQGGSQAEALILNGTPTARAIIKDVDLYSFQDTLQINGQAYVSNAYIEGDVDFMWGTGPVFLENSHARTLRSNAYYTQVRNPETNHGYVFYHCTLDGAPGVTGNYLSRIQPGRFPASEVVLIDSVLGPSVGAAGWMLQGGGEAPRIRFWEFNSHDAGGMPVDVSRRMPGSRQLRQPQDAELIANYSDPAFVLGGWNPRQ